MAFKVSSARASLTTAVVGALLASPVFAADMPFFPSPEPAPVNTPIEFGTGWYLRGDVGYQNANAPVIIADLASNLNRMSAVSGGVGIGYQFNNWFRTDLTLDRSVFRPTSYQPARWCPYGTVLDNSSGTPIGYLYDPNETCSPVLNQHLERTSLIANGYFDLGTWWNFTPYVGAGLGVTYFQGSASVNYYQTANGLLWAPNLGQPGVPIQWVNSGGIPIGLLSPYPWTQLYPNENGTKKTWRFAWNLMAGVSYEISQNVKIDLGYRFLNAGSFTSMPSSLSSSPLVTRDIQSHEVRLGVRLSTD